MKKIKHNKNIWLVRGAIAVFAIGLALFVRSQFVSPQIAEIAQVPQYQPQCTSNVSALSLQDQCGSGSFKAASFKCINSDKEMGTVYQTCMSYTEIMAEAQKVCGETCVYPSSTPKPSASAYPTPTPKPTPTTDLAITCKVNAYKLYPTDNPQANPRSYATPDRLVDLSQGAVNAGESYALLVDAVSPNLTFKTSTVSAVTSNLYGSEEPIKVLATTQYCSSSDQWSKYMSCTHPGVSYTAGVVQRLDVGMTVQIQSNISQYGQSGVRFGLYNILESGTGLPSECYVNLVSTQAPQPASPTPVASTPTSTPTPTPPVGCTYEKSTCFSSIFGGECKLLLNCPAPSPSLQPKPVATNLTSTPVPTVRPTPTPLPVAPSGCYFQKRLCLSTIVGGSCAPALYCPKPPRIPYNVCMIECRPTSTYARCFRSCLAR